MRKLAHGPWFDLLSRVPDLTAINEFDAALQALVPPGVCASAGVVSEVAEPFPFVEEGQHLVNAVSTRRNEFIGGRRCARAALAQLGQATVALPADADGVPMWPVGWIGSISHSRGLCCAVAAPAEGMTALGLDLEKTTRLSARAMERVVHPAESVLVGQSQRLGSLLFSAKEAFFKAQYPVWGAQPNFHDLALQIDLVNQALAVAEVVDHLPAALKSAAKRMQLRYRFFGDYVVTLCWLERP
jgi:4'-phosphopantetheinyl transferase EntD